MGHTIFIVMHLAAIVFGTAFLFVTIPGHLIFAMLGSGRDELDPNAPTPTTHVRCPDCRELVLKDAKVCKHCRCRLVPQV